MSNTTPRSVRVPRARAPASPGTPAAPAAPPRPARGTRDDLAFTATPQLLRGVAREWFLRGFASSGHGFHGEACADAPAVRALLDAEFDRQWGDRDR